MILSSHAQLGLVYYVIILLCVCLYYECCIITSAFEPNSPSLLLYLFPAKHLIINVWILVAVHLSRSFRIPANLVSPLTRVHEVTVGPVGQVSTLIHSLRTTYR